MRAPNLSGLPPALVVTCEFDPLRDRGSCLAQGLVAAGVEARHLPAAHQIHTSVPAVDVILYRPTRRGRRSRPRCAGSWARTSERASRRPRRPRDETIGAKP